VTLDRNGILSHEELWDRIPILSTVTLDRNGILSHTIVLS
jgi:hypothetical protein